MGGKIENRGLLFISYYPLKQGLKPHDYPPRYLQDIGFISYYPLKQGLKREYKNMENIFPHDLYPTIH